ncbi:hypothetical protein C8F01DRAFT_144611 [Mycena amicta]|nr:hypothetical protein C8F01DRAFT_144611 [Mycena amicta]
MSASQVPDELWLEVCKKLPLDSLRSVFCTNIALNRVSRPFVFEHLVFEPYLTRPQRNLGQAPEKQSRLVEALDFYLSEPTASFVRSCYIHPAPGVSVTGDDEPEPEDPEIFESRNPVYSLLNRLLGGISSFSQLRVLDISVTVISADGLAQIMRLPLLERLTMHLETVDIQGSVHIPTPGLRLSELSLQLDGDATSALSTSLQPYWNALMNPLSLRIVTLDSSISWWAQAPANVPIFPTVERLTILADDKPPHPNFTFNLGKFPVIHDLGVDSTKYIFLPDHFRNALIAGLRVVLPQLTRILASHEAPRLFIPIAPALKHIELCRNHYIPASWVVGLPRSETITTMCLTLSDLNFAALEAIVGSFPCLEELRVKVSMDAGSASAPTRGDYTITAELWQNLPASPILPVNMKTIAIVGWVLRPDLYPPLSIVTTTLRADVEALRDAFVARFPELDFLKLKGDGFFLSRERRMDDSGVEERIVVDRGEMEEIEGYRTLGDPSAYEDY